MKLRETMWAEMKPDVYAGDNCDEHRPQWEAGAAADKGDSDTVGLLLLDASQFPPGTKVVISEPECPHCLGVPTADDDGKWRCCDAMDWHAFAAEQFS